MRFCRIRHRTACGAIAVMFACLTLATAAIFPAHAQSQGPSAPSTVDNDPATGDTPWTIPQEAAVSDDSGALIGSPDAIASYYLKATDFGFAIPDGAVIEGIRVDLERKGASAFDRHVRIVKAGVVGATDKSLPGNWMTLVDVVMTYGGPNDLWGETWTAADINSSNFGFALSVFTADGIAIVDAISVTVFYSNCGNNQIDVNEDCDDGNTANGDCCSTTCQFEASGAPCPDGTVCNGSETCNGAGTCQSGTALNCDDGSLCTQDSCDPMSGCVNDGTPVGSCRTALKSILILKDNDADDSDKLAWSWLKGPSTMQTEFGVPTSTTKYSLCIYAGTPAALIGHYDVPADAMKWAPISTKGYKYGDSAGSADGLTKVLLKGSTENRAKCLVKGKGGGLDDFELPQLVAPVTVQLVNGTTSLCLESTFDLPDFITFNDPAKFKAKSQ